MKVKTTVDFDIFEDEDWLFDEAPQVEFFGEDLSEFYEEPKSKRVIKIIFISIWWVVALVAVIFTVIVVALRVSQNNVTDGDAKRVSQLDNALVENVKLERIKGDAVSSAELIDISKIFSRYTFMLSNQDFASLSELCEQGSSLSQTEQSIREKSTYSLDRYDSTARAYRAIASKISLKRVNDVIYNSEDGLYYCYVTLSVPHTSELFEYYLRYSYELTQFLNSNGVSMVSFSKYANQTIEYKDYPVCDTEYLFKVKSDDGSGYVLTDDSELSRLCDTVFDEAVNQITQVAGSRLPKENLD